MGKCKRCGQHGLFFKVNINGYCPNCVKLIELENEEVKLQNKLASLSLTLSDQESLYKSIRQKALDDAKAEAQRFFDAQSIEVQNKLIETKQKTDELAKFISNQLYSRDRLDIDIKKRQKKIASAQAQLGDIWNLYRKAEHVLNVFENSQEPSGLEFDTSLDAEFENALFPTVELKLNCLNVRELRKRYKKNEQIIEDTLYKYKGRYTTKANIAIYSLMVIALRAELQNILYNIKFGNLETAIENVKDVTAKYLKIATDGNQNIASTMKKFIAEIEFLFIEAVNIEYEYFVQKERSKEEQRAIREQMRQEAEERRLLEQQKKQVEREESKYKVQIESLNQQLTSADDEKTAVLQAKIAELQAQLSSVEEKKTEIIKLQNGKAGHVYVISNLGSFGDDMFKIGMTRRLEPLDRVNELGNASVPFPFDVHSMIFSDDAVGLESKVHEILNSKRVNRVNLRKEFFRISIDELEELILSLDPSAEFKKTMVAEQFRQSQSIIDIVDTDDATDISDDLDDD